MLTVVRENSFLNSIKNISIAIKLITPPERENIKGKENNLPLKKPPARMRIRFTRTPSRYSLLYINIKIIELASPILRKGMGKIKYISKSCNIDAVAAKIEIGYILDLKL